MIRLPLPSLFDSILITRLEKRRDVERQTSSSFHWREGNFDSSLELRERVPRVSLEKWEPPPPRFDLYIDPLIATIGNCSSRVRDKFKTYRNTATGVTSLDASLLWRIPIDRNRHRFEIPPFHRLNTDRGHARRDSNREERSFSNLIFLEIE